MSNFSRKISNLRIYGGCPPVGKGIIIDDFTFEVNPIGSPVGVLEQVTTNGSSIGAFGWSVDQDYPEASNTVQCWVDGPIGQGRNIGTIPANHPGDSPYPGNHRFAMPIPADLRDGNTHQIYCYGLDFGGSDPPGLLSGSPKSFRFNTPIGYFDSVDADGNALGWSMDADLPLQSNSVHFYIDGQTSAHYAGQTVADIPRPDVNTNTGYPGDHGFKFSIPPRYRDNQQHTIYAYGIDLNGDPNKLLPGSPKTFTLSPTITGVTYEQIATDDLPFSANPKEGGGLRIFPDNKNPADQIDRRKIRVKARVSSRTAGVRIYFRNFDLDDPSADTGPIDPGDGSYDNNGSVEQPGFLNPAGLLSIPAGSAGAGCIAHPRATMDLTNIISCTTDSEGVAVVDYTLTRQPGDNFAVVASVNNETYLKRFRISGLDILDPNYIRTLVTTSSVNECEISAVKTCRTEMLTVWRRLHIEVDSMGTVSGNKVEGTVVTTGKVGVGQVSLQVNTAEPLGTMEFERGRMVIGTRSFPVVSSSGNSVMIQNQTIFNLAGGESFTLYDDDDFNDDDPVLNGDEGDNIPEPFLDLLSPTDTPCPDEITAQNCNVLAAAYIRPVYDLAGSHDEVPFSANTDLADIVNIQQIYFNNIATEAREDFWTIYLLGGYQYVQGADGDPDSLDPPFGENSIYGFANLTVGTTIFTELTRAREFERLDRRPPDMPFPPWRFRPVTHKHILAHEIGHLFGADHTDIDQEAGNAGLMDTVSDVVRGVYSDTSLFTIRNATNP
ncbi:MAG: hypothetical protein M3384_10310 [Acidobacteriota bacterium]|nr:hypothetical protein [Acidobacteriota bacterium]